MALKLDMAKAYDGMEQDFIGVVLEAFGFNESFVQIIREYMYFLNLLFNPS